MKSVDLDRFHNALRILYSIDKDQLIDAIGRASALTYWEEFRDNPHRTFLKMPDKDVEALWILIESRQPKK